MGVAYGFDSREVSHSNNAYQLANDNPFSFKYSLEKMLKITRCKTVLLRLNRTLCFCLDGNLMLLFDFCLTQILIAATHIVLHYLTIFQKNSFFF